MTGIGLLDLPGPQFLFFYIAAFWVVVIWGRQFKRRALTRDPVSERVPTVRPWSAYQVACLAGGTPRLLSTVLAQLAHRGAVVQGPRGHAYALASPLPQRLDELECAVCALLVPGPLELTQLQHKAVAPLQRVEYELAQRGWLVDPKAPRTVYLRRVATVPLALLCCLGVMEILLGIARDKPVIWLIVFVLISGWVWKATHLRVPRLTTRGEQQLASLNERNSALSLSLRRSNDVVSLGDLTLAVALFGTDALATGPLSWMHPPDSASSGGTSSSGDGGSGGGGNSSCGAGGGCGGCGGGGCS